MSLTADFPTLQKCMKTHTHTYTHTHTHTHTHIQGVTGGTDQTSGECSLGQTIPI